MIYKYPPTEPDRARLSAQRKLEVRRKIEEFLNVNLTLQEAADVVDDLHHAVANDLRRKAWHREARKP
jgi:hypothetical protein